MSSKGFGEVILKKEMKIGISTQYPNFPPWGN
jgi:hypothetical protein